MRDHWFACAAWILCAGQPACSGSGSLDAASGGAASGGSASGGSASGGAASGGSASGGSASGGAASGGAASGSGVASGGAALQGGAAGKGSGGGGGGAGAGGKLGAGGAGGAAVGCKRGIAANTAPGAAFSGGVGWWYNWAISAPSGAGSGIEFVPMIWGKGSLSSALPSGAKFVLGFNEPNFHAQANLTAEQAASYWPMLESKAKAAGIPLVAPGMNYCGPAADCNGTDPYQYLKDFFAACASCQVDYVAVHWYNCDLPSLKDYLEPGGNLPGFEQFGKPIWLTEFSCDPKASVANQEAYMRAALPYLEQNPHVFRYSWFSADPIPNAKLVSSDGSATPLGEVYRDLPQSCR